MAHPLKTRAIASARIKTDKIDFEILALLSRSNSVPQSYVINRETRFRRELIRYRASLVRLRATIHNSQWASRLLELYGIGKWTALLIVSEIGDIGRFPSAKHLCSYAGLVPSVHVSGNTSYTGHITKQGSKWLRWPLVEAVHHAMRKPPYRAFYQKTAKRRGKAIAKVAVAQKLLKAIYHLLREKRSSSRNEDRETMSLGRARSGVMVEARP